MDWLNSMNQPLGPPIQRLTKAVGSASPPPNFDHLLGRHGSSGQQQQQQLSFHARHHHQGGLGKGKGDLGALAAGKNVRLHPAEMQRFLTGLMNKNSDKSSPSKNSGAQAQDMGVAQHTGLQKGPNVMNAAISATLPNIGGDKSLLNASSHSSNSYGGGLQRAKNDKAVEVFKDHRVIARFRTQTECARYLRATPEAVSYHCSKGGGVCNGLVIRPLGDKNAQSDGIERPCGLFDGADEARPKERPQLKPETVQILRDWLLSPEHMDNPYPNARETEELMQRTGLDKTQMKHWFNNARKRILKPLLKGGKPPEKKKADKKTAGEKKKAKRKRKAGETPPKESKASKKRSPKTNGAPSPSLNGTPAAASSDQKMPAGITPREQQLLDEMQRERGYSNAGQNANMMEEKMLRAQYQRQMGYSQGGSMPDMSERMMPREMMMQQYYSEMPTTYDSARQESPMARMAQGSLSGGGAYGNGGYQGRSDMAGYCMDTGPGQDRREDNPARRTSSEGGIDSAHNQQASGPNKEARINAVFKQQVATMAMNEASSAFTDMEEAFARAKDLASTSAARNPDEDDPLVVEANERAKRLQGVAMFKLKVSQRASEEAAGAYGSYQEGKARASSDLPGYR